MSPADSHYIDRLDDQYNKLVEKLNNSIPEKGDTVSTSGSYLMSNVLGSLELQKVLAESNILIFGVIGFFDPICRALSNPHDPQYSGKVDLKKTYPSTKFPRTDDSNKRTPLLILPTAENHQSFNRIVAKVLHLERPAWVVALPSQLDSHLFSSFNCFFISSRPMGELKYISNITPVIKDDILELQKGKVQAIVATDAMIPSLSIPNRMGSVIYVKQLDI